MPGGRRAFAAPNKASDGGGSASHSNSNGNNDDDEDDHNTHADRRSDGSTKRAKLRDKLKAGGALSESELAVLEKELAWLDMPGGVAPGFAKRQAQKRAIRENEAAARRFNDEIAEKQRRQREAERRRKALRAEFLRNGPRHVDIGGTGAATTAATAAKNASVRKQQLAMRTWAQAEERADRKQRELSERRRQAQRLVKQNEADIAARRRQKQEKLRRLNAEAKARVRDKYVREEEREVKQRREHRQQYLAQREASLALERERLQRIKEGDGPGGRKMAELFETRERRRQGLIRRKVEAEEKEAQARLEMHFEVLEYERTMAIQRAKKAKDRAELEQRRLRDEQKARDQKLQQEARANLRATEEIAAFERARRDQLKKSAEEERKRKQKLAAAARKKERHLLPKRPPDIFHFKANSLRGGMGMMSSYGP